MPYIEQERREQLEPALCKLVNELAMGLSEGELNYVITRIVHHWVVEKGICYATFNAAIGVLGCAKAELYSQHIIPYERKKEAQNGKIGILPE